MATLTAPARKVGLHSHATFVRDTVETIPLTQQIIDAIMPYFPLDARVIGGYVDDSNQYWKVNYHWEYLITKIEQFGAMDAPTAQQKTWAQAVWKVLMTNPPLPERGYLADKRMGDTKDISQRERVRARHKILRQSKKDFRGILIAAGIVNPVHEKGDPPKAEKGWWLSVAPVAPPGQSTHGAGYALDIAGNNNEIKRISKWLGSTLEYNEASHLHVEFKNNVRLPAMP